MALIEYISTTFPAGSTNGYTTYRNGGQIAMRARAYPVRVTSARAQQVRNIISQLSIFWESPLTDAQRIAWGNYAFNTALTDAWGHPRYIRGYAHYMRSNRPRLQFGLSRIDNGPTTAGLPTFTLYGFGLNANATTVSVYFEPTDSWVTTNGAHLLLWASYLTRATTQRPTETFTPFATITGSSTSPPSSPATFPLYPSPGHTSGRTWLRASLSLPDGRLSL